MCTRRDKTPVRFGVQLGLTMIELIMFIVIVSVGITGILLVMNVTVKSSADPMLRKQSISMAEAILEEVLSKDYTATLPETNFNTCPNRALYVGVDDYACFDGAPATAVIKGTDTLGASAVAIAALATYSATVSVTTPGLNGVAAVKKITVTVTDPSGTTFSLSGYKANY